MKINVTAMPNGSTGDITATVTKTGLAEASDNGDGTWTATLKQEGTSTITFKAGTAQTIANVKITA